MHSAQAITREPRAYVGFVVIGLVAGLFSGLFGVGGGTVIVPLLVLMLHFDQRRAAGTSLAAIVPIASVGVLSYAQSGSVAWIPALILALAAVIGAQVGTRLVPRVPQHVLTWAFVAFVLLVMVLLFLVIPSRAAQLQLTWGSGVILAGIGVFTGLLAGLIGVGGGVIIVPALILALGVSDLVAKGTSLLTMIPTAVSGTIGNLRYRNIDPLGAVLIGVSACTMTALGAWLAAGIDPFTGNVLFAAYLAAIAVQMTLRAIRLRGH